MEKTQFTVQLANYNNLNRSRNSLNYQRAYKIGPIVSSECNAGGVSLLKQPGEVKVMEKCETYIFSENNNNREIAFIDNKLDNIKLDNIKDNNTLNDSKFVTKLDISIQGREVNHITKHSKQGFITSTFPISKHSTNHVKHVVKSTSTAELILTTDCNKSDSDSDHSGIDLKHSLRNNGNYSRCSCCNEDAFIGNYHDDGLDEEITVKHPHFQEEVKESQTEKEGINLSFNYLKENRSSAGNTTVYSFCATENCHDDEIEKYGPPCNEIEDINLNANDHNGCATFCQDLTNPLSLQKQPNNSELSILLPLTGEQINGENNDNKTNTYIGYEKDTYKINMYERNNTKTSNNLMKEGHQKHILNTNQFTKELFSIQATSNLSTCQQEQEEGGSLSDQIDSSPLSRVSLQQNNINNTRVLETKQDIINGYTGLQNDTNTATLDLNDQISNRGDSVVKNKLDDNYLATNDQSNNGIKLQAPDIVVSASSSTNMAGKISRNSQPDVISVPERTKLFMKTNVAEDIDNNGENWNLSKQKKVKKILTLPRSTPKTVFEENEAHGATVPSVIDKSRYDSHVNENRTDIGKYGSDIPKIKIDKPNEPTQETAHNNNNRILHVPISNKVIIPVLLKDPSPPNVKPKRKTGMIPQKSDLEELKEMAKKLNLCTRRPSYLLWKERLQNNRLSSEISKTETSISKLALDKVRIKPAREESDRIESVSNALKWLKRELTEMRSQDQVLARTLLKIRQDIREFKLQQSCAEHQEILADAIDLEEEKDILGELSCDFLQESFSPTLKQVGVTRMHIGTRRFSVF